VTQLVIATLYLVAAVCFGIGGYFAVFWLRRISWTRLDGKVVGHGGRGGGMDDVCELAIIEVSTTAGSRRFSSQVASFPPVKLGTRVTVLQSPDGGDLIECTLSGVLLFSVAPLVAGLVIIWLANNSTWDVPNLNQKPNKTSLLTPDPPPVPAAMTATSSTRSRSLAHGQA
jgi:hypothetical protein